MPDITGTGLVGATVVHDGGTIALHDVTLLAEPGELLVVLGPSGSGKSTLLKAIAGLVDLRRGSVRIDGADATHWQPERRDVAMAFEYAALLPFLDVSGNLGFGLTLRHHSKDEVDERVQAQARGLGLTRLLSRRPSTLSAGERAQVGIGRALIRVPKAFLLDEPLGHHDAASRADMRRHISIVIKALDTSTIYVTHDQSEALAIGDRVAVLRDGAIVQVSSPHTLYAEPADTFVARFVGSVPIGLLPATVLSAPGMSGFRVGASVLPVWTSAPPELRAWAGRRVMLGIRAEDVRHADADVHGDAATLPGVVTQVEYTGADMIVTATVDTGAELRARFPGRTSTRAGWTVRLAVDLARAHVFDPDTGEALLHLASAKR
jgi:multiple sugar transport system ATP-binding protein